MKLTDLLPRGHNVETPDTSEHRILTGCYFRSLPAHFEMDVRWRPSRIHQEQRQCRQTRTRKNRSYSVCLILTLVISFPTSLMASVTSTPAMLFTETSRVYVVIPNLVLLLFHSNSAEHPGGQLRPCTYRGFRPRYSNSKLGFCAECLGSAWPHRAMGCTRDLERRDI